MAIFLSAGDSFTFGTELQDCHLVEDETTKIKKMQPSQLTWAALSAKHTGFQHITTSSPGISNSGIARKCIYQIDQLHKSGEEILVGIMWTFVHRFEIYSRFNERPVNDFDSYQTVGNYHAFTFEEKLSLMGGYQNEEQLQRHKRSHEWDEAAGLGDISRIYQQYIDNTFYLMESLKSMLLIKSYLESKNIDYFFLKAANIHMDDQKNYYDPYVRSFKTMIDTANWLPSPYFCDWSNTNKYKIGPANHPLEEAHAAYTDKFIIPYLMTKGYGVS